MGSEVVQSDLQPKCVESDYVRSRFSGILGKLAQILNVSCERSRFPCKDDAGRVAEIAFDICLKTAVVPADTRASEIH